MALTGVMAAGIVSLLLVHFMGINLGHGLGLCAGSGNSTPALQAAIATLGNDDPGVGCSVGYPFGMALGFLIGAIAVPPLRQPGPAYPGTHAVPRPGRDGLGPKFAAKVTETGEHDRGGRLHR